MIFKKLRRKMSNTFNRVTHRKSYKSTFLVVLKQGEKTHLLSVTQGSQLTLFVHPDQVQYIETLVKEYHLEDVIRVITC